MQWIVCCSAQGPLQNERYIPAAAGSVDCRQRQLSALFGDSSPIVMLPSGESLLSMTG